MREVYDATALFPLMKEIFSLLSHDFFHSVPTFGRNRIGACNDISILFGQQDEGAHLRNRWHVLDGRISLKKLNISSHKEGSFAIDFAVASVVISVILFPQCDVCLLR